MVITVRLWEETMKEGDSDDSDNMERTRNRDAKHSKSGTCTMWLYPYVYPKALVSSKMRVVW